MIHRTAVIHKDAIIADDAIVGPFCHVGKLAEIGSGCHLNSHVVIYGPARIGRDNHFFQYSCIGSRAVMPDMDGHDDTGMLRIGDNNVFHEYSSVNRGMAGEVTTVGSDNLIMSYCHFSHNCQIGDHNVLVNRTHLADSVNIADNCNIAAGVLALSQCHIGSYSMVGAGCVLRKDVPAFTLTTMELAKARSISFDTTNRQNCSVSTVENLQRAFDIFYLGRKSVPKALEAIRRECHLDTALQTFINSLKSDRRTVINYAPDEDIP